MESKPIAHQFEFWSHLGRVGGYIHPFDGYTALIPKKGAWPAKTFLLQNIKPHKLIADINTLNLPKSIALDSSDKLNYPFEEIGLIKTSVVEGMTLDISSKMRFSEGANIYEVVDSKGIRHFAEIASDAFGYNVHWSSLIGLLRDGKTQLFLGKYENKVVSCGILFLDNQGDSGLHMIGSNKQYRGLGFGKEMTQHLLFNALKNKSDKVHLVASKFGAPIYRKYGFINTGYLNSYTF